VSTVKLLINAGLITAPSVYQNTGLKAQTSITCYNTGCTVY